MRLFSYNAKHLLEGGHFPLTFFNEGAFYIQCDRPAQDRNVCQIFKLELLIWSYRADICNHFEIHLKSLVQIELEILTFKNLGVFKTVDVFVVENFALKKKFACQE